ncbi:MAG TPA: hypothetical protein VJS68_02315, partial [Thermoplasmata archaeon]|nr:hypothetical protein [Thermoplasmata archaeon]
MPDYYSRLLEWRRAESAARGLAKLPADFYGASRAYLEETRRTFEEEVRGNPSGRRGDVARQTYQRAGQVARDIVEARMTKVLSAAFQASVGGSRDLGAALPEERSLYEEVVRSLSRHRTSVAPFLEATGSALPEPPVRTSAPAAAAAVCRESSSPKPPEERRVATVYVRILKDQRAIETHGEKLDLRKEDILSLPPSVAQVLISGKV